MASVAKRRIESWGSLCERILRHYIENNGEHIEKAAFVEFAYERYQNEIQQQSAAALRIALGHEFGNLTRRKGGKARMQRSKNQQQLALEFNGKPIPQFWTLPPDEEGKGYRHVEGLKGSIADAAKHARIRKENGLASLQEADQIEDMILAALEVSGGDPSWTWEQVLLAL